ncbi:hypothetical protein MSHOH_3905 [Methanosarcina horonobensis HB-1 = JCM 15518]|uniref:Uncharacterized protein n=1 Tax=Methanosarcina horonobensis HB-1 = JCM 15518 TaxID=1434110 RepID=A0A0E3SJG6_9EURY|nr:hypothetical protein [Methanosarcina horonobensis]AKB80388.1 hypothetical protein MSHOH_3905 [Methanosarcina horonobensis HB-1 = JCM 15518]
MGTKPYNLDCSGKRSERVSILGKEIKSTREKMEKETRTFIEATKNFSLEWIQREMSSNMSQLRSEDYSENVEIGKDGSKKLSRLEDLPLHIQDIVEDNLNRDDYWIHRNGLFQADISHDYVEFKKEKTRKDLTSSIRMILGCAAEIFTDLKDENHEVGKDRVWVKERGRRKYICVLRFSDEMTASLDRYFTMLEELFVLEYEIKKVEKEVRDGEKNHEEI